MCYGTQQVLPIALYQHTVVPYRTVSTHAHTRAEAGTQTHIRPSLA